MIFPAKDCPRCHGRGEYLMQGDAHHSEGVVPCRHDFSDDHPAASAYRNRLFRERYLGDGLYASFDGWQFTLRAPREGGDHYVCLDPSTFQAWKVYMLELNEIIKQMQT